MTNSKNINILILILKLITKIRYRQMEQTVYKVLYAVTL